MMMSIIKMNTLVIFLLKNEYLPFAGDRVRLDAFAPPAPIFKQDTMLKGCTSTDSQIIYELYKNRMKLIEVFFNSIDKIYEKSNI